VVCLFPSLLQTPADAASGDTDCPGDGSHAPHSGVDCPGNDTGCDGEAPVVARGVLDFGPTHAFVDHDDDPNTPDVESIDVGDWMKVWVTWTAGCCNGVAYDAGEGVVQMTVNAPGMYTQANPVAVNGQQIGAPPCPGIDPVFDFYVRDQGEADCPPLEMELLVFSTKRDGDSFGRAALTADGLLARVTISYAGSHPDPAHADGPREYGGVLEPYRAPRGDGPDRPYPLRLWAKAGDQSRDPRAVADAGDYVEPGQYTWAQLRDAAGEADGSVTLWVEAIHAESAQVSGWLELPDPANPGQFFNVGGDGVRLNILPRPRAVPDFYEVTHDRLAYFEGDLSLLANDISVSFDLGDGLLRRVVLVKDGEDLEEKIMETEQGGRVEVAATGSFIYIPPTGYVGEDTFQYKVGNGVLLSGPITATMTVKNAIPVGQPEGDGVDGQPHYTVRKEKVSGTFVSVCVVRS